jgi:hypothetical protein
MGIEGGRMDVAQESWPRQHNADGGQEERLISIEVSDRFAG